MPKRRRTREEMEAARKRMARMKRHFLAERDRLAEELGQIVAARYPKDKRV